MGLLRESSPASTSEPRRFAGTIAALRDRAAAEGLGEQPAVENRLAQGIRAAEQLRQADRTTLDAWAPVLRELEREAIRVAVERLSVGTDGFQIQVVIRDVVEGGGVTVPGPLVAAIIEGLAESQIQEIERWQAELEGDYSELTTKLIVELRRFGSINLGVYGIMLALLLVFRARAPFFVVPAILLLGVTIVSLACYLFLQNWTLAILEGRYWGWGTAIWMGVIFVFVIDILYLNALIVRTIIRVIIEVLGSLGSH
jgi:hypothetical protein